MLIMDTEWMMNPSDAPQDWLVCLNSGVVATSEITDDMFAAQHKNEIALMDFFNQQLFSAAQDIFFSLQKPDMENIQWSRQNKNKSKSSW